MKKILIILFFSISIYAQHSQSTLKYDCNLCHECENPTKLKPCLKSCPRNEVITVYHSAENAPKIIKIDLVKAEKDIYQPVNFTHKLHAEMSNMAGGCTICHHYNPVGRVVACRECHENQRKREELDKPDLKGAYHRQCLSCHKTWSKQDDCNFCHLPNSAKVTSAKKITDKKVHPKIETPEKLVFKTKGYKNTLVTFYHDDHTKTFGLECTNCHNSDACAKCHNQNLLPTKTLSKKDKHAVCSSCHDVKSNCQSCHKTNEAERFNHVAKTGFEIKSYHSKLECSKCHRNGKTYAGLKKECSNCHSAWQQDFNHEKTGLKLNEVHAELECENCHNLKTMKVDCSSCHDEANFYPKNLPGKRVKK
ncbi:MAG: hypothetical protein Fur0015_13320 [Ignavibacteriales bacterium]